MRLFKHSQQPTRNILWHIPTCPVPCEQSHEKTAHEVGGAIHRRVLLGSPEAK